MKIFILPVIILFITSCNELESNQNLLNSVKKIEPILESTCNSKAVLSAYVYNNKFVDVSVLFLTKEYKINHNISCSNTDVKDTFISFFQKEYGYSDVNFYIKHDKEDIKL